MPRDDEIQWLDAEAPAAQDVIQTHGPRWSWWYLLAAAVIVVAVIVAVRPDGPKKSATRPSPTPTPSSAPSSSASTPSSPLPAASTPPTSLPSVTDVGRPLLAVPADWELFGRADASMVRIQLAAGRVTVTPFPLLSSDGPASFVVGPDRALVLSLDQIGGYSIVDGQPYQPLSDKFPLAGPALPGPDPTHIWIPGHGNTMVLVDFQGNPTGPIVTPPADVGLMSPDGAGYMLFYGVGGVYDVRPNGVTRITTGQLLATGPTGWVADECDAQFRCATTVINRSTGARHTIAPTSDQSSQPGSMSPDGRTMAWFEGSGANGPVVLHLVDLASGADRATTVTVDPDQYYQDGLFAWSPDSSWLFTTNATGRVYAINAKTAAVTEFSVVLGPISQIALRTGAGS